MTDQHRKRKEHARSKARVIAKSASQKANVYLLMAMQIVFGLTALAFILR